MFNQQIYDKGPVVYYGDVVGLKLLNIRLKNCTEILGSFWILHVKLT